jgi:hypothetical protein
MNKEQLTLGQKVYLKPVNNAARRNSEIREQTIVKIGRKYFFVGREGETNERFMTKFSIEDLREVTEYSADWEVYFSRKEILDEEEFAELSRDIRLKFSSYGRLGLTLGQLRRIKEIINE